jgi:hypothetical protein
VDLLEPLQFPLELDPVAHFSHAEPAPYARRNTTRNAGQFRVSTQGNFLNPHARLRVGKEENFKDYRK